MFPRITTLSQDHYPFLLLPLTCVDPIISQDHYPSPGSLPLPPPAPHLYRPYYFPGSLPFPRITTPSSSCPLTCADPIISQDHYPSPGSLPFPRITTPSSSCPSPVQTRLFPRIITLSQDHCPFPGSLPLLCRPDYCPGSLPPPTLLLLPLTYADLLIVSQERCRCCPRAASINTEWGESLCDRFNCSRKHS